MAENNLTTLAKALVNGLAGKADTTSFADLQAKVTALIQSVGDGSQDAIKQANAYTDNMYSKLMGDGAVAEQLDTLKEISEHILNDDNTVAAISKTIGDNAATMNGHIANTTVHVTADERSAWNSKANAADTQISDATVLQQITSLANG